ncbi:cyclase family protein [Acuticoccus sp. M5D2P5]|uniref:cyclase family protein n=1 Tax=Acuticoccus kalidii TaxID=2910977 RepID=UPI001F36FF0A|nr:cyclase family protein [Acuticoccus kalidii]MCF3933600.1 cyclase family protein [Acuticoccus kalidii]
MARIVDLSVSIEPHFRWPMERSLKSSFADGAQFQVTWLGLVVHGFTHIDSPRHMLADGKTSSDVPLEATIGEAAIVDITSDIAPQAEITAAMLDARGGHVREGDIVLLKTCWDEARSLATPEFWTDAPYLGRDACEWLLARKIKALAPDFPQDYPIRQLLGGVTAPMADFVSHDVLLRNGVILIEYVANFGALTNPRTTVYALPLKLPDADGCPARVIAVEPD